MIKQTIHSLLNVKTNIPFEVIVIDNDSSDRCCDFLNENLYECVTLWKEKKQGIATTRNTGARLAKGDYYIFCDGHLLFEDYWIDSLIKPIQQGIADAMNPCIVDARATNRMGFGYTWGENLAIKWNPGIPMLFPSALLAGGCLAISKKVFNEVGQFDAGFRIWGYDDQEISLKLWLFGYQCYVQPKVKVYHFFRVSPPPYQLTKENVYFNFLRMAYLHFNEPRIEKCKRLIKDCDPEKIEQMVLSTDTLAVRNKYNLIRKYHDNWFMKKFGIPF